MPECPTDPRRSTSAMPTRYARAVRRRGFLRAPVSPASISLPPQSEPVPATLVRSARSAVDHGIPPPVETGRPRGFAPPDHPCSTRACRSSWWRRRGAPRARGHSLRGPSNHAVVGALFFSLECDRERLGHQAHRSGARAYPGARPTSPLAATSRRSISAVVMEVRLRRRAAWAKNRLRAHSFPR